LSEIKEARLQKANSLVSKGFASYAQSFKVSHTTKFLIQKFDYLENGQEEEFSVSLAGRVMAKRIMGKIAFFTISDQEGQIQLYLDKRIINLNLDGVFVYMSGSKPITDFLGDQIALKEDGGVIVDDFMSTNSDGVWAIGDIRNTPFKQAVVAASDGCIAAMSIDRYLNSRKNIRVDWIHS